jgi:hypothetical protein
MYATFYLAILRFLPTKILSHLYKNIMLTTAFSVILKKWEINIYEDMK